MQFFDAKCHIGLEDAANILLKWGVEEMCCSVAVDFGE